MAHIYCGSCKGHHLTVNEVRACHAAGNAQRRSAGQPRKAGPRQRGNQPVRVIHVNDPVSPAQIGGIKWRSEKLGLDYKHLLAQVSTKGEASALIKTLEGRIANMPAQPQQNQPQARPQQHRGMSLPLHMVKMLKPGRYAMRTDESRPYVFFRVSCPETGRRQGVFKIQTQHGDNLRDRIEYLPNGRITKFDPSRIDGTSLEDWVTMLLPVQHEAALDYGMELGRCCRCGADLTDEESRYFGIGPECTKYWPWIHEMVEASRGEYQPV